MRKLTITVIGDSVSGSDKYQFCEKLGILLAELDTVVITGGMDGIMEAVSKGVSSAGGTSIGILPSENKEDANPYCDIVIPTGLGHARNTLTVMASDIVIAVGGQAGTLTEIGFAWIYRKPIIVIDLFGGWSKKLSDEIIDHRRKDRILPVSSLEELKENLVNIALKLGYDIIRK